MKLRAKTALGIDLSDGRINLALLEKNKDGVKLLKTATGTIPEGAIENGNIEDQPGLQISTQNHVVHAFDPLSLVGPRRDGIAAPQR